MRNYWHRHSISSRGRRTSPNASRTRYLKSKLAIESLESRVVLSGDPLLTGINQEWRPHVLFAPDTAPASVAAYNEGDGAALYQLDGRWTSTATNGGGLGQGDPTTLTWSIIPDSTRTVNGSNGGLSGQTSNLIARLDAIYGTASTTVLEQKAWFSLFVNTFKRWSDVTGINFVYAGSDDGADQSSSNAGAIGVRGDIRIGGHNIDNNGVVLAYNYFPNFGEMVIDTSDTFFENSGGNSISLRNVVSHELGHGIGIEHVESNNASFLMEPFASTSFDGPQFDDILGAQRQFGDNNENNDSAATATSLKQGAINNGETIAVGVHASDAIVGASETDFVSIDGSSDVDYFSFTIASAMQMSFTLTPLGPTYNQGPQGGTQTQFVAAAQNNLAFEIIASNGTTVLATANANGLGQSESMSGVLLNNPGTYYVRITGAQNAAQFYQLQLSASQVVSPAAILGTIWNDVDGDSVFDAGEAGLSGVTVFLDQNKNGALDAPEISTVTNSGGGYTFQNLSPGTYTVAQVVPANFQQTFPDAGALGAIMTRRVASGLSSPLFVAAPPGDTQRLFILEKNSGAIKILNLNTGVVNSTPFLTVSVSTESERGLLGLAFHPNFQSNGLFYICYTAPSTGTTVVQQYQVSGNPNVANAASARTILTIAQPQENHNGGWLDFGPDGYLYIGVGDGGGGNDQGTGHTEPNGNAQDITNNLLGKMLRIDVDGIDNIPGNGDDDAFTSDPNRYYSVPLSNPFVGVDGDDEIWAYGLRNPWRSSFDSLTGDLYIGDVGQGQREEINFQSAGSIGGENYGWRLREGTIATPSVGGTAPPGSINPLYEYLHGSGATQGNSVTGGYVYRGPIASLQGKYFFGDFVNSRIWSIEHNGQSVSEFIDWTSALTPDVGTIGSIASFGQDDAGNLYIVDFGGEIFRVQLAAHTVTLGASDIVSAINFGNQSTSLASISGTVWFDADADGVFDAGESGQSGVTVFLDSDGDGVLDAGEQSRVTTAAGTYTFAGLAAGTYTVAQVVPNGYTQTVPTQQVQAVVNEVSQSQYTLYHRAVENMGLGHYGGAAYNQGVRNRDGVAGPGSLGNQEARLYLQDQFAAMGLNVSIQGPYLNVVAELPGISNPEKIFIIGAHYDHVAGDSPGGDDNASGTAGLLEAARILSQYRFDATIRFIGFNAEEDGLLGSQHYVNNVVIPNSQNIVGMINMDMILRPGSNVDPSLPIDLDLGTRTGHAASVAWANAFRQTAAIYVPELTIDATIFNDGGRSDQDSFVLAGLPAFLTIENTTDELGIANPYYHSTNDASDRAANTGPVTYNFGFATDVTQGAVAILARYAALAAYRINVGLNDAVTGVNFGNVSGQILDNGSAGFAAAGGWTHYQVEGYQGDIHFSPPGSGSNTATWTFATVQPGQFRVSTTWVSHSNRATNAPFQVLNGSTPVGSAVLVNQELAPNDFSDAGGVWEDLGVFTIQGNTLVVRLTDAANEYVIADAIRIERVGELPTPTPEITVLAGTTNIADGTGTFNFGSTPPGTPLTQVFTVRNDGAANLTLADTSSFTLPAGYSLISGWSAGTVLAAGASSSFTVRLNAAAAGSYSGMLSFANGDGDENPFNFTLQGTVASTPPPPVVQILDNGSAGFATVGGWTHYQVEGYQGDIHFSPPGSGSNTATWTFTVQPGQFRVSTTWVSHSNRATNAPFQVLNGSTPVGSAVLVNQELAPNDFSDAGGVWEDLGVFTIQGNTLVVRLTDAANEYVIADAIRIERVGELPTPTPEITVLAGTTNIADGTGTFNFGSTPPGTPLTQVFTVRNDGTANLTLADTSSFTLPAGYSLISGWSAGTVLAAGASSSFTVRLNAAAAGSYSGMLSFANGDGDENPFNFTLQGTVASTPPPPVVQILDNGSAGFATVGGWTHYQVEGYQGDIHFSPPGSGSNTATWTFTVQPGQFRVSTTWVSHSNRATNAPFQVLNGSTPVGSAVLVNQELAPNDFSDAGGVWEDLGVFTIQGNTLVVRLTDAANEYVIADAIRIERVGELPTPTPEITVLAGTTNIADGTGTFNFGSTPPGTPLTQVFTVRNDGTANLTLADTSSFTLPAGYSLISGWSAGTVLAAGASSSFTVRLNAAAAGSYSGMLSFANGDGDENPFNFTLQGTVASTPPPPVVQILDNGSAGFATVGGWTHYQVEGYQGDIHFSPPGSGSNTATWTFTVQPGQFRVSTTWVSHSNRATNAPFQVLNGSTPVGSAVLVNQELAPNDFSDAGGVWEDLGVFTIQGNTLVVRLTDAANEYVIADAIRIERVGELPTPTPEITVLAGTTNIADGTGTFNFGSTPPGTPLTQVFTVRNDGTANLTLADTSSFTLPAGYSLISGWSAGTVLAAGASSSFTVRLDAAAAGSYSGMLSFANGDGDENPFNFTLQGTVASTPPPPVVQILDNGSAGFATVGGWTHYQVEGYQGDIHFSPPGSGSNTATWTFTVQPGQFRVSTTWVSHSNRATNAPFQVLNGSTPVGSAVLVNQELAPNDFSDAGGVWEDLGVFTIQGNTLVVRLTDAANEYVIADAIRIERVGDIQLTAASMSLSSMTMEIPSSPTLVAELMKYVKARNTLNDGVFQSTTDISNARQFSDHPIAFWDGTRQFEFISTRSQPTYRYVQAVDEVFASISRKNDLIERIRG